MATKPERKFIRHRLPEWYSDWNNSYSQAAHQLSEHYAAFGFAPLENITQVRELIADPEAFVEKQILIKAKASGTPKIGELTLPDNEIIRIFGSSVNLSSLDYAINTLRQMNSNRPAIWQYLYVQNGRIYFNQEKENEARLAGAVWLEDQTDHDIYNDLVRLRELLDKFQAIYGNRNASSEFYKKYLSTPYNVHFDVNEVFSLLK